MEAKFQDLLKNIIPGFYILFGIMILFSSTNWSLVNPFEQINDLKIEIQVLIFPFILYIMGYINDIFSSFLEFRIYELFPKKRPSFVLLNNLKKRYKLSELDLIKQKLEIENDLIDPQSAYLKFQKANTKFNSLDNNNSEYYLSYIFSRNMMGANSLIMLFSLLIAALNYNELNSWLIFNSYVILSLIFIYRWKQKALYYSKKVFNSVLAIT